MAYLRFHISPQYGPAYSGFWVPGTSGNSDYLTNHCMVRVRAGRYYWVTGIPENTLPPRCEGQIGVFSKVAKATVVSQGADGVWLDGDDRYYSASDSSIFAFAYVRGKLHLLHEHNLYAIRYQRTTMTEINLYRSWT